MRGTAFHEAGHAVVAHQLGRAVQRVSIRADDNADGHTRYYRPRGRWYEELNDVTTITPSTRARLEGWIMSGWAGPLAEEKATGEWNDVGAGFVRISSEHSHTVPDSDMAGIIDLASLVCGGNYDEVTPYLEWLRVRTLGTLSNPFVWERVVTVADALAAHEVLSGPAFARTIESSDAKHLGIRRFPTQHTTT